jgi:hypothetical protein
MYIYQIKWEYLYIFIHILRDAGTLQGREHGPRLRPHGKIFFSHEAPNGAMRKSSNSGDDCYA